MPIILKLLQKVKRKECFQIPSISSPLPLYLKEIYRPILRFLMIKDTKILNKILATKFTNTLKGLFTMNKWDLFQGRKVSSTPANQRNTPH